MGFTLCESDFLANQKAILRKESIKERKALDPNVKISYDRAITKHLFSLEAMQRAQSLFLFLSLPKEVNTDPIIKQAWLQGLRVAAPKTTVEANGKRVMQAYELSSLDDVVAGSFGIREPAVDDTSKSLDPTVFDVVLVPGLAFTKQGARLGYGGGYYDRYLTKVRPDTYLIGIAYDMQIVPTLPVASHDHFVHAVVTETHVYQIS